MDSKERVKRAINFDHPDRVPISHAVLPAAQLKYGQALTDILAKGQLEPNGNGGRSVC